MAMITMNFRPNKKVTITQFIDEYEQVYLEIAYIDNGVEMMVMNYNLQQPTDDMQDIYIDSLTPKQNKTVRESINRMRVSRVTEIEDNESKKSAIQFYYIEAICPLMEAFIKDGGSIRDFKENPTLKPIIKFAKSYHQQMSSKRQRIW